MENLLAALIEEPLRLIKKYYDPESELYYILVEHGKAVAQKALAAAEKARRFHPDRKFLVEAAMLHDIGIFLTDLPEIGCKGNKPYICHGCLGREILEKEGLPAHALVCERHVGAGINREEIIARNLPLPPRDMVPVTLEEQIICFADKFFSKNRRSLHREKTIAEVRRELSCYGSGQLLRFQEWAKLFADV